MKSKHDTVLKTRKHKRRNHILYKIKILNTVVNIKITKDKVNNRQTYANNRKSTNTRQKYWSQYIKGSEYIPQRRKKKHLEERTVNDTYTHPHMPTKIFMNIMVNGSTLGNQKLYFSYQKL